jgi:hypothetical protein
MDLISVTCPVCQKPLQFPADKAGSKANCPECGSALTIPTPNRGIDDEDGGAYAVLDVIVERKALPTEKKKEKSVLDPSLRKKKKLQDADKWNLVRGGLTVMSMAAIAWGAIYALQMLVVLLGCYFGQSEMNSTRVRVLFDINTEEELDPPKQGVQNRSAFVLALLYGTENVKTYRTVQILLAILSIFPMVLFVIGYVAASKPPRRYGMRGQIKALMILALVNAFIVVFFRVVPLMTDKVKWGPLPYIVPELPLLNANEERFTPLHVTWMRNGYLEILTTIVFICIQWAEYVVAGAFIYTMGFTIKDEQTRDAGKSLVYVALGTAFLFIVYHLASLAGCSVLLIAVLRLVYIGVVVAQLGFISYYVSVLNQARTTLDKRMEGLTEEELEYKDDDDEDDDDDDDDDDDEEDSPARKPKPKPSRGGSAAKRRRQRDDDDDDDDDEDDRKKRKRKGQGRRR